MFIKSRISKSIRDFVPQCFKIKDFLKVIDEQFVHSNKALTNTLMKRLLDMSFDYSKGVCRHIMEIIDYSKGVCRHIMEMKDTTTQLKSLEVEIIESFLTHFILNSLPMEYGPLKISYNTYKKK